MIPIMFNMKTEKFGKCGFYSRLKLQFRSIFGDIWWKGQSFVYFPLDFVNTYFQSICKNCLPLTHMPAVLE